jgi:hypothetical protein
LLAPPEYQDKEPLYKEADHGENPVNHGYETDRDPVCDTDKKFEPAGIVLIDKNLVRNNCSHQEFLIFSKVRFISLKSAVHKFPGLVDFYVN